MSGLTDDWPPRVLQALHRFLPESIAEVLLNRVGAGRFYRPERWEVVLARREIIEEICRRAAPFLQEPDRDQPRLAKALAAAGRRPRAATVGTQRLFQVVAEADVATAHTETLETTRMMGLTPLLRTRSATIVSELARRILHRGGQGRIAVAVEGDDLVIRARVRPPEPSGSTHPQRNPAGGMTEHGLQSVRRLADSVNVHHRASGGTLVTVKLRV